MTQTVTPLQLKAMLRDGRELALLDVREGGRFSQRHLLLACPVKGWFRPIDRAETIDDIETPDLR